MRRRFRRGIGLAALWVPASFGVRRFPKGERKALWCARRCISLAPGGIGAPTTAREQGLRLMGFSPASVPEGFQRVSGKPFGAPAGAYPLLRRGNDAPTSARKQGLQPYGAFTLFFRWRKKSVQKKASGTATPGKSPLLPIFERGSSQCRAQNCWRDNPYVRARSCSLLSSFKKGKAFSLRCLSPLLPPRLAWGMLKFCGLGNCRVSCVPLQRKRPAWFQIHAGLFMRAMRPVAEWRSTLADILEIAPDPRAARPSAERR